MSGEILFLAHRLPFPPDRGDKIRSHHLLKALAALAPVHVGCLAEGPADVRELAGPAVTVWGEVPAVQPFLAAADLVVAPLAVARGVQNKVLEAMAMARPVVASAACADGIDAKPGAELVTAATPADFVQAIDSLLRRPEDAAARGDSARRCVLRNYSWESNLARLDSVLATLTMVGLAA